MVSHEFRTPLAIIQSSAELLREFFQRMQPAERDEQLESITGKHTPHGRNDGRKSWSSAAWTPAKLEPFNQPRSDLKHFCRRVVG
jgi:signal transduction histidine kinase